MAGPGENAGLPVSVTALVPRRLPLWRRIASGCVFWVGLGLMGLLALPAGCLLCGMCLLEKVLDRLLRLLERPSDPS